MSSLRLFARTLTPRTLHPQPFRPFSSTLLNMGVQKTVISNGSGPSPKKGDTVTMEYTGWLRTPGKPEEKGSQFDSSIGRGSFVTKIGVGQVIKGWDEGVVQMQLGEKARLDITSDFAYGSQAVGGVIPANSDLIFEVELKKIN
ncbi:FK506 binding protein proline rotamase rapamycin-binding protein [Coniothyrium glycines]